MHRKHSIVTLNRPWNDETRHLMFYFATLWDRELSCCGGVMQERHTNTGVRRIWIADHATELQIYGVNDDTQTRVEMYWLSSSRKPLNVRKRIIDNLRRLKRQEVIDSVNESIIEDIEELHRDWEESTLLSFCLLAARMGHPVTDVVMKEIHARFGRGGKYENWIHDTPPHIRGMRLRPQHVAELVEELVVAVRKKAKEESK